MWFLSSCSWYSSLWSVYTTGLAPTTTATTKSFLQGKLQLDQSTNHYQHSATLCTAELIPCIPNVIPTRCRHVFTSSICWIRGLISWTLHYLHIKRISISEAFEMGVHSDAEHGSPLFFSFLFCRELSILRMRNILLSQTNRWVVKRDAARSALWYRGVNWLRAIESLRRRRRSSSTRRVVCSAHWGALLKSAGSLPVETAERDPLYDER